MVAVAVLRGEAFEQRVGVRGEPDLERPVRLVGTGAVEDEDAARALQRNEAGERVPQLAGVLVLARVEEVVAVEEVENRFGHPHKSKGQTFRSDPFDGARRCRAAS